MSTEKITLPNVLTSKNGSEDQETVITYNRTDDRAEVYTSDNTTLTKLKKMVAENPTEWRVERVYYWEGGSASGVKVSCPKNLISLRTKSATREYSEEERQERSIRMRKTMANKD